VSLPLATRCLLPSQARPGLAWPGSPAKRRTPTFHALRLTPYAPHPTPQTLCSLPPVFGAGELRHQLLVEPAQGWNPRPPTLLAKGPGIAFSAGAPQMAFGPVVPGFDRLVGRGMFGQPGFDCAGSIR